MSNISECCVCKDGTIKRVDGVTSKDAVDKCSKWLETCTISEEESVCSCETEDSSHLRSLDSCSTYDDSISYDSRGLAVVDKIKCDGDYNIESGDLSTLLRTSQNVYQNVQINKSRKIHLGNVTYINGPVYINQTRNTINQLTTINQVNIPNNLDKCKIRIVDRKNWLAQPALDDYDYLKDPAKVVIICHSATEDGSTNGENILLVRLIQQFHIESRRWGDIAYNFLIGADGNVYEGRGWGVQGAHTFKYNRFSVGICFVGCYINKMPPEVSLKQAKALIERGVEIGAIDKDYSLVGHCQCLSTESPGRMLYQEIKTWKNFDDSISVQTPSPLIS